MARPNPLEDAEFAQQFAEAVAEGVSRSDLMLMFSIRSKDTITRWKKDPRVKVRVRKIIDDRILEITRRTDSQIAARLQKADRLSVRDILAIRKEFLGGALRLRTENIDDEVIGEAVDALENNPQFAEQLATLLATTHKE